MFEKMGNKVCGAEAKPKVEEVREENPNASPAKEALDSEKSNSVSYSLRADVKIISRIFFRLNSTFLLVVNIQLFS